ncbi:MAG: putative negative regulator of RcsB-dependent stress response [Paraglaciecola psychrophila]|jgi:predicted negative regulator of RcsB-dependent stress response
MAEGYESDDEQIEALKQWWHEHGTSTVVTVVVALACYFGWQGWQSQQQESVVTASSIYENMLVAAGPGDGTLTSEQRSTANHLATTLKQDFPDSTYAQFAALYKAKLAVAAKNLTDAEQELQWVMDSADNADIVLQATLRLARVLYAQQKYPEALALLDNDNAVYAAAFEEVRGDIYNAQGERDKAKLAYLKASELNQQAQSPSPNPLLELKIEQLNSKLELTSTAPLASEDS